MTAQEFLISKKVIPDDVNVFNIMTTSGPVDLIQLMDEYINASQPVKVKERAKTGQKTKPAKK